MAYGVLSVNNFGDGALLKRLRDSGTQGKWSRRCQMVLSYRMVGHFHSFETVLLVSRLTGFWEQKTKRSVRQTKRKFHNC